MKVRTDSLSPFVARGIIAVCAVVFVVSAASATRAAGVVGTGTAASCADAALGAALAGGGVVTFNCGSAPVTIDLSTGTGTKTISADTTIDGGGLITVSGGNRVGVFSVNAGVTFTVQNLTIANGNASNSGGGTFNESGTLTVTNCTFSGNSASLNGGGILNSGALTVTNSTFSGNSAGTGSGGGIANLSGTLTVTNSTFSGNSAGRNTVNGGTGGGIFNHDATMTVADSTFSGNSANGAGGGIDNESGTLTITNSTFSGNRANGSTVNGGTGGGIFNEHAGTLTVTNSTFSGNSANGPGGGIGNELATLTVTNCTFSGNSASPGGGIDNHGGGMVLLRNTIVADSTDGNCSGRITDGGHNLDDDTTCVFSAAKGSLSNTNPQLDPAALQSNGGVTQTVALCTDVGVPAGCTAASPAIDAGDQAVCAAAPVNNRDQRGLVRPGAGHTQCSIGAYEAGARAAVACVGDCDGTGSVTVDEIIALVNIALGTAESSVCPNGVVSDTDVDVALIIQAVNAALDGCAG